MLTKQKIHSTLQAYISYVKENQPLIIFLPGMGERGTDLEKVMRYGPARMVKDGINFPLKDATIMHLQIPTTQGYFTAKNIDDAIGWISAQRKIDWTRVYLMGVSLGGYSLIKYMNTQGTLNNVAAIVLMSPGKQTMNYKMVAEKKVPIWIAHAKNDPHSGAPFSNALAIYTGVNKLNPGQVRLTHMGLTGHSTGGAWGRFMIPDNYFMWDWLILQNRLPTA